jgi:hypothetical protein
MTRRDSPSLQPNLVPVNPCALINSNSVKSGSGLSNTILVELRANTSVDERNEAGRGRPRVVTVDVSGMEGMAGFRESDTSGLLQVCRRDAMITSKEV